MHNSNQSPEEQPSSPSQPLFEFSTDNQPAQSEPTGEELTPSAPPTTAAEQVVLPAQSQPSGDDAIRQGLVYPPPPSFYQNATNEQLAQPIPGPLKNEPPLPLPVQPRSEVSPTYQPPFPPPNMPPGYGAQPPFPIPPGYGPFPTPPAKPARSKAWIWIVIAVLGITLISGCALCLWVGKATFGNVFSQEVSIVQTGTALGKNYYDAIQAQDYAKAYTYFSPQASNANLTQAQFTQQAQSQDTQFGPVLSYTPSPPSIDNNSLLSGNDVTHFTMAIDVQRQHKEYSVLLTFSKVHNQWKITDFDRI